MLQHAEKEYTMEHETKPTPKWGPYLTYSAAERYAGFSRSTLWRMLKRGDIEAIKVGASVRIVRESLDVYLVAHAWTSPDEDDRVR